MMGKTQTKTFLTMNCDYANFRFMFKSRIGPEDIYKSINVSNAPQCVLSESPQS